MDVEFRADVFTWRGPAPFYFVRLPDDAAGAIEDVAGAVSYGWGMVPVRARIGDTAWTTSLWPKDGSYVLPLKVDVRRAERIEEQAEVDVRLDVDL